MADLAALQIAEEAALVAVFGHEDGLLSELVDVLQFQQKFAALIIVVLLYCSQFLVIRLDLSRLGLEHPDLGTVDCHHFFVLCAQGQVGTFIIIIPIDV